MTIPAAPTAEATGRRRRHRPLKWWQGLIFIAVSIVLALAMAEAGARLMLGSPKAPQHFGSYSQMAGLPFSATPNTTITDHTPEFTCTYTYNSLGWRDVEHAIAKPASVKRWLVLGDSFSMSAGVSPEQSYANIVVARLPGVELLKAASSRYWPEPERMMLESYGLQFSPDLVTCCTEPNDFLDTVAGMDGIELSTDGYLTTREASRLGPVAHWTYLHTQLGQMSIGPILRWMADKHKWDVEGAWRTMLAEHSRMLADCKAHGAVYVVIFIPEFQMSEHDMDMEARLSAWCAANSVTFVDTLPTMRAAKASSPVPLYYTKDGHCTARGYAVVAQTVYEALCKEPILAPRPSASR